MTGLGVVTFVARAAIPVLYDRRTAEFYRAGPADFEGLDEQLRDAALHREVGCYRAGAGTRAGPGAPGGSRAAKRAVDSIQNCALVVKTAAACCYGIPRGSGSRTKKTHWHVPAAA